MMLTSQQTCFPTGDKPVPGWEAMLLGNSHDAGGEAGSLKLQQVALRRTDRLQNSPIRNSDHRGSNGLVTD